MPPPGGDTPSSTGSPRRITPFPHNSSTFPATTLTTTASNLDASYLATKHITAGEGKVLPTKDRAASDHDAVAAPVGTHKGGWTSTHHVGPATFATRGPDPAALRHTPPKGEDPHQVLAAIAKAITVPGGGSNKFQESQRLKQLRQAAQQAPAGAATRQAWKLVSRTRKQEHRLWMQQQAEKAANLDWRAMRSLQMRNTHKGWHLQLQDDPQWQKRLGEHMQGIFAKPQPPGGGPTWRPSSSN